MTKYILPAVMILAFTSFAASAAEPAKAHEMTLSKQKMEEIVKACRAEHKGDKAGYKKCVKEKVTEEKAAETK